MSADIGCTFPPCMNTAYGWDIFHRSSCCCRSHRKSSSAWRPCFSSASVSAALCRKRRRPKQTASCYCICDVNSQTFTCRKSELFLCLHQSQWKVWRVKSTSMNCVSPTSMNSIDSSAIEWPPTVLRGSTISPDCWTLSRWWDSLLQINTRWLWLQGQLYVASPNRGKIMVMAELLKFVKAKPIRTWVLLTKWDKQRKTLLSKGLYFY